MSVTEITKDKIRELFTTMHLSQVTVGGTLRRSKRLAEKRQISLDQIPTIGDKFYDEPQETVDTSLAAAAGVDVFTTPARQPPTKQYNLTPLAKEIFDTVSPEKQEHFLTLLKKDDAIIKSAIRDIEDKPYNEIDGSEMGVYIESWICANLKCPGCKQKTLYKYTYPNMPVVDVACVNPNHALGNGPRYYQIKATQNRSNHLYFTRTPILKSTTGYIKVGSKRYGHWSHEVQVTDSNEDKELVVGYICISYTDEDKMRITIKPDESFILIPNLISPQNTDASHHAYYKYLYTNKSVVVCYNSNYVMAFSLREYFTSVNLNITLLNKIEINYLFQYTDEKTLSYVLNPTQQTDPPVPQTPSAALQPVAPPTVLRTVQQDGPAAKRTPVAEFYKKYLMYKTKYINLKLSNLKLD
jgi:hypothetical protein